MPCAVEIPHVCAVIEYQKASLRSAFASPRVHPVASANPGYPPHRCFQIHWRVILSESMRYITCGMWWLSVLPGATLLLILLLFESIGQNLKTLVDPFKAQE